LVQRKQEFRVSPQLLHTSEFKEIVREVRPDIMHVNQPFFLAQTAMAVAKEYDIPVVGTSHFMPENLTHYLHLPDQLEKMLNSSIWRFYAWFYGTLNLIISPTQTAADLLIKLRVGTKVEVISNGIDLQKFNVKNSGEYLKKRYELPDKPTLLFVGRLDKEKNIQVLIRASAVIQEKVDFHIVIVGKGKEEEPLKELVEELGLEKMVTFTAYLPKKDLPNIYKVADIFVMPSIAELQSLVTMEAMACGLPVVGANAVALPHLIKDKRNGFLFTPGDYKELAQKLLLLLTDKKLREQMGKESLEIIKDHDMSTVVVKVENVYKEVIKNYKSNPIQKVSDRKRMLSSLKRITLKKLTPQDTV
jgi:glycosyltransferase involved in cell wall biosynthesis